MPHAKKKKGKDKMTNVENWKIVLVVYKLVFKEKWIGNVYCTYDYDTSRDGFKNLLKIDIDIKYPITKSEEVDYKNFECEIICFENSSQSFDIINKYIKSKYLGTQIIEIKSIFEFNFEEKKDNKIKLTSIITDSKMIQYEIESLKSGKFLMLSAEDKEEAIIWANENLK